MSAAFPGGDRDRAARGRLSRILDVLRLGGALFFLSCDDSGYVSSNPRDGSIALDRTKPCNHAGLADEEAFLEAINDEYEACLTYVSTVCDLPCWNFETCFILQNCFVSECDQRELVEVEASVAFNLCSIDGVRCRADDVVVNDCYSGDGGR